MFYFTEFIVVFKGYYRSRTRENFIAAALNNANVEYWRILERKNPAADYPSDFDVVIVCYSMILYNVYSN